MGAAGHTLKMRQCASSANCRSVSVCRCCELVLARGALSDRASRCQPCEHQDDCIEMCQTTRSLDTRFGCMQQDLPTFEPLTCEGQRTSHDLDQKAACYKDLDAIGFGKTQDDCMIKMRLDHRRATLQQAHRSEQIWAAGHARLEKKMQMDE